MIKLRTIITSLAFASLCPLSISAQKLQVGSYTFKDGSIYTGDMTNNKPNGKGRTQFRNGDVYEGFYLKGKRNGDVSETGNGITNKDALAIQKYCLQIITELPEK